MKGRIIFKHIWQMVCKCIFVPSSSILSIEFICDW